MLYRSTLECYHTKTSLRPLHPALAPNTMGQSSESLSTASPSATPSASLPGASGALGPGGADETMGFTASALPSVLGKDSKGEEEI